MANRSKSRNTPLRWDKATGRWCAKLGKKKTKTGNTDGHLFRFNTDERESLRRKQRIQEFWDFIVDRRGDEAIWCFFTLPIAQAFADGQTQVVLKRGTWSSDEYARHVHGMTATYTTVTFVPEDLDWYQKGADLQELSVNNQINKIKKTAAEFHRLRPDSPVFLEEAECTVGQALEAFENFLRRTMLIDPDREEGLDGKRLSDTAVQYCEDLDRIRRHNATQMDWPLSRLTYDGCDAMLQVWSDRPRKKDDSGPMSVKTCKEHAKRLMAFFRWLSKSGDFKWSKPTDFDLLRSTPRKTNQEKSARLSSMQVPTFTEDELRILNEYALPFERLLLLFGLNLGFKRMECATLRVSEILLHQLHDFSRYITFSFTETDSFVRRIRIKSEVFGEWILWPLTVQGIEWALDRRRKQTHIQDGDGKGRPIPFSPDALLLLSDQGHSFTKPTKSGNSNHRLTNTWNQLLRRVQKDFADFPHLPHEALRDTSSNWIREEFGGEIAEVFLSHGSPIGSSSLLECYTNKPWGKVFEAIRWLASTKIAPMLKATPENPFPNQRKLGGGGLTLKQRRLIVDLFNQGLTKVEIAKQVGCSEMSVYRHVPKIAGNADLELRVKPN